MGVYVILDIDPNGMDAAAWAAGYDEALGLLNAWQPPLLGWGTRTVEGHRVAVYTRKLQNDEANPTKTHWTVVGDQKTGQTAEVQRMYRDLAHYGARKRRKANDIVVTAADPKKDCTSGPVQVFGNKTQGYPYHFAMLAVGMLMEERFPQNAMVWGDINAEQANEARREAQRILGRELPLPVRTDAERLVDRLRVQYSGDDLVDAFDRVFLEDTETRHETALRVFPGDLGAKRWLRELAHFENPNALGVIRLLIGWLNTGHDIDEACRMACLSPEGPKFAPEAFADALASTWVSIPEDVRSPVEAFRKSPEDAPTIPYFMGSFLLDMEAMGRLTRVYIPTERVVEILKESFGDKEPAAAAKFVEETTRMDAQLREHGPGVREFVEGVEHRADDQTELLATLDSIDHLGKNQRSWVHAVAFVVNKSLEQLRTKEADSYADVSGLKFAICRILSQHGPVLTEDAWDKLQAEQDPDVIHWLTRLLTLPLDEAMA